VGPAHCSWRSLRAHPRVSKSLFGRLAPNARIAHATWTQLLPPPPYHFVPIRIRLGFCATAYFDGSTQLHPTAYRRPVAYFHSTHPTPHTRSSAPRPPTPTPHTDLPTLHDLRCIGRRPLTLAFVCNGPLEHEPESRCGARCVKLRSLTWSTVHSPKRHSPILSAVGICMVSLLAVWVSQQAATCSCLSRTWISQAGNDETLFFCNDIQECVPAPTLHSLEPNLHHVTTSLWIGCDPKPS
jgi:hypothetical protein